MIELRRIFKKIITIATFQIGVDVLGFPCFHNITANLYQVQKSTVKPN